MPKRFKNIAAIVAANRKPRESAKADDDKDISTFIMNSIKGEKGDTGEQGDKGERGEKGDKGERGFSGPKGNKGERGEKGPKGFAGPKGNKGDKGDKGDKGTQGEKGEKGDRGPRGLTGNAGETGKTGSRGPRGFKGLKGDKGEKGDKGDQGLQGNQGEKGDSSKVEFELDKKLKRFRLVVDGKAQQWVSLPTGRGGRSTVAHDDTLSGKGTEADPLSVEASNLIFDYLTFNTEAGEPERATSRTFWDETNLTLSTFLNEYVTLQHGQELVAFVCNETAEDMIDGQAVYLTAPVDGISSVELADARFFDKSRVIGIVTQPIEANGGCGFVTVFGRVRDFDTSGLSAGTVYLDPDNLGGLTNTKPTGGNFPTVAGTIQIVDSAVGELFVNIHYEQPSDVTNVNGFSSDQRSATVMSFDNGTRTFTIDVADSSDELFYYYQDGIKYIKEEAQSIQITDVQGLHIIFFDAETLTVEANPTSGRISQVIRTKCIVSYIYWDATNNKQVYFADERHGINMDPDTHTYLHFTRGFQFLQGLGLSDFVADADGSSNTHAQFSVAAGFCTDEDIVTTFGAIAVGDTIPIYYLFGTNADFRQYLNTGFAVTTDAMPDAATSTGRLVYNNWTGTEWTVTAVPNNDYVLCHLFAINSYEDEYKIIAQMGQAVYGNVIAARSGANTEISNLISQLPTEETIPVGTIIYQVNDSYTNDVKARARTTDEGEDYVNWLTTELAQGVAPASHANLTNRTDTDSHPASAISTTESTFTGILTDVENVKDALETIDAVISELPLMIETPEVKDYILMRSVNSARTIKSIVDKLESGSLTYSLKINSTEITGIDSVSCTTTEATRTATAANVMAVGDDLILSVESVSSPEDFTATVRLQLQ